MASRMVLEYDRPIYRGESSGTACMTNLPSRPSNISLPEEYRSIIQDNELCGPFGMYRRVSFFLLWTYGEFIGSKEGE